ncbi:MAG: hypothetical protein IKV15_01305 [Bacteroidaceae bacterium]|nr:hypothetical protein [Bacteroidaceae bacterium]MBR5147818.1 hypothetical protein [Bacteroidaceae bacterium]
MGFLANLFRKKTESEENKVGGIEDFMTLIRVYYQAVMAGNLGISNINMLPDLAMFKRSLKVATQNNKLGVAEKSRCKKMLMQIYGLNEGFFKEIDASIKKNCRNVNMVNGYFFQFQRFNESLMMAVSNEMKYTMRIPFKKWLYSVTEAAISNILTKNNWKDEAMFKTVASVRQLQTSLGYSGQWMTDFVFNIVRLAKKEPKKKSE